MRLGFNGVFEREVPFIAITEAVHARIIDDHLEQLRASARLHEVFTDLAVAGAGPGEILRQAALLAGRPVILEDLAHRVLDFEAAGADPGGLLEGFEARSRAVAPGRADRLRRAVGVAGHHGGCAGRGLGAGHPGLRRHSARSGRHRAGGADGDHARARRLLTRQHQSLERQAHATLISAILAQADADPDEAAVRARALGIPVAGRLLVTAVLRFRLGGPGLPAQARVLEVAEAMADACRSERIPALVGPLDDVRAGALLSLERQADPDQALTAVCDGARQRLAHRTRMPAGPGPASHDPVIGIGSAAPSMREVRRSLLEAQQVADAAAQAAQAPPGGPERPFYRLADLRLRGLLYLLAGDSRLGTFVERELGPLTAYDAAHGSDLTGVLEAYLAAGGNKAVAAARRTWPGPPSTSGCATSSGSWGCRWMPRIRAPRCTSPCWPGRRRPGTDRPWPCVTRLAGRKGHQIAGNPYVFAACAQGSCEQRPGRLPDGVSWSSWTGG